MLTLILIVGYLATTVLPSAWAMRSLSDRQELPYCHVYNDRLSANICRGRSSSHARDCWRSDGEWGLTDFRTVAVGTIAGLAWPALVLPALALHIAKRKPTPGALQRRIAELEKEVDL